MVRKPGPSREHMNIMPTAFKEGKLPTREINLTPNDVERFWKKVYKGESCWIWTGDTHKGYGSITLSPNIKLAAHRVAYTINKGQIPAGMIVCHKCDRPPCVNPDHLFLGTHQDNTTDRISKGRGQIRLSAEKASQIKHLVGVKSASAVARQFGVSPKQISEIWDGLYWKHAPGPMDPNWRVNSRFYRPIVQKVSKEDGERILELYATGQYSFTKLGKMFGVNHATIKQRVRKVKVVKSLV